MFRENSLGDMLSVHSSKNFIELTMTLCILDALQPRDFEHYPADTTPAHNSPSVRLHVMLSCKTQQKDLVFTELVYHLFHRKSYELIVSLLCWLSRGSDKIAKSSNGLMLFIRNFIFSKVLDFHL